MMMSNPSFHLILAWLKNMCGGTVSGPNLAGLEICALLPVQTVEGVCSGPANPCTTFYPQQIPVFIDIFGLTYDPRHTTSFNPHQIPPCFKMSQCNVFTPSKSLLLLHCPPTPPAFPCSMSPNMTSYYVGHVRIARLASFVGLGFSKSVYRSDFQGPE